MEGVFQRKNRKKEKWERFNRVVKHMITFGKKKTG
jgi:hypothetical protein